MIARLLAPLALLVVACGLFANDAVDPAIPKPEPAAAELAFAGVGRVEFAAAPKDTLIRYTLDGSTPTAKSYAVCSPVRVGSTLTLKAACFRADGTRGEVVEVRCTRTPDAAPGPLAAINIDDSEAADLHAWALRAQTDGEKGAALLLEKLGNPANTAPRQITIAIRKDHNGTSVTRGDEMLFSAGNLRANAADTGVVIFHLTRTLQKYGKNPPGWVGTGIADWIRWHHWEAPGAKRPSDPRRAKYTNGFGDAAAFLAWIEKNGGAEIARKLHKALIAGEYSDDLFKQHAGKTLPELWTAYVDGFRAEIEKEAAKAVDRSIASPKPSVEKAAFADIGEVAFDAAPEGLTLRYTLDGSFPAATSDAANTPIRVASTLILRAAFFNKEGKCSEPVKVECIQTPDPNAKPAKPTAAVNVDFSGVPDLKDWAIRAQKETDAYYATMVERLMSDGFKPPRQILLIFKNEADVKGLGPGIPAFARHEEGKIWFRAEHIRGNPNDFGMVIHEVVHLIQAYGYSRRNPSWLVEGIADYIRWENWEPVEKRRRVDPMRAKYTDGYSNTARFLAWIEKARDKEIISALNTALRHGTYSDEVFKKRTGKDIPELWKEFAESYPAKK